MVNTRKALNMNSMLEFERIGSRGVAQGQRSETRVLNYILHNLAGLHHIKKCVQCGHKVLEASTVQPTLANSFILIIRHSFDSCLICQMLQLTLGRDPKPADYI